MKFVVVNVVYASQLPDQIVSGNISHFAAHGSGFAADHAVLVTIQSRQLALLQVSLFVLGPKATRNRLKCGFQPFKRFDVGYLELQGCLLYTSDAADEAYDV